MLTSGKPIRPTSCAQPPVALEGVSTLPGSLAASGPKGRRASRPVPDGDFAMQLLDARRSAGFRTIMRLVLGDWLKLVSIGLVLGALSGVAIGVGLSRFLYGLSALDATSFAGAALVLLVAGRAVDPLTVLRSN